MEEKVFLITESNFRSWLNDVLDEREKRPKNRVVLRGIADIALWYKRGQKTVSNWLKQPELKKLIMRTSKGGTIVVYEDEFTKTLKQLNLN